MEKESNRLKLVVVGDSPEKECQTGFSKVTREAFLPLREKGFEITFLGINGMGWPLKDAEGRPITLDVTNIPAGTAGYKDPYGVSMLPEILRRVQPDCLLLFNDLPIIREYLMASQEEILSQGFPVVGYFPIDAPGITLSDARALRFLDRAVTYTNFGKDEAEKALMQLEASEMGGPDRSAFRAIDAEALESLRVIGHSANPKDFYPMDRAEAMKEADITLARDMDGDDPQISEKDFIVLNVSRNQSRKAVDLTVISFVKFLARARKEGEKFGRVWLYLHMDPQEPKMGWDLLEVYRQAMWNVGLNPHLKENRRLIFTAPDTNARNAVSVDKLRAIYNSASVFLLTSEREGWGLPLEEAALCGLPLLMPNIGPLRELWGNGGTPLLIPIASTRHDRVQNAQSAIIDTDSAAGLLERAYRYGLKGQSARARVLSRPNWESITDTWADLFNGLCLAPLRGRMARYGSLVQLAEAGIASRPMTKEEEALYLASES